MTNWFYYNTQGEKVVVSSKELKKLALTGKITPGTFVEDPSGRTGFAKDITGLMFAGTMSIGEDAVVLPDTDEAYELKPQPIVPDPPTATGLPINKTIYPGESASAKAEEALKRMVGQATRTALPSNQTLPQINSVLITEDNRAWHRIALAGLLVLLLVSAVGLAMMYPLHSSREQAVNNQIEPDLIQPPQQAVHVELLPNEVPNIPLQQQPVPIEQVVNRVQPVVVQPQQPVPVVQVPVRVPNVPLQEQQQPILVEHAPPQVIPTPIQPQPLQPAPFQQAPNQIPFTAIEQSAIDAFIREFGDDVRAVDPNPSTPGDANSVDETLLHKAVRFNKGIAVVRFLVAKGADVNAKNKVGITPLAEASYHGDVEVAKFLVSEGADVNAKRYDGGTTPLWWATRRGHFEIVKILVAAGADINDKNNNVGTSPLDEARKHRDTEIARYLESIGAR